MNHLHILRLDLLGTEAVQTIPVPLQELPMLTKIIQLSFSCSYSVSSFFSHFSFIIFNHVTNHLSCRFARRIIANNPTRENTIPNPGDAGVPVAVTVVTSVVAVSTGVSVGAGVIVSVGVISGVSVDENGDPIAARAAAGFVAW